MNKQVKAKLKYLFFHIAMYSPDTFTFEGNEYLIIDKNKLNKRSTPLAHLFLIIMLPMVLGVSIFKNVIYYILIVLSIFFVILDWNRLPKDIFQYLERK